ncbi:AbrB family transcriptional regulator [Carnobacterium maltaromaticum]|uniref:AbrB/MazE/SpoVT family DNA-binding domain-containing protein n=1 Tax=Carnobacterium TaxID=2747 RepID=UPI0009B880A0|nr:AbrB family transcriptional regulator [Carnobacterium maltaromaticum]TFJ25722.1 AbrB family transcriptional regulator [Carnobacterium maltaromaticum]TFJ30733.1 AbrB family transcriptional regulator [Carnobacterium maltaromaticum]TFJ33914.1 AbrB family transcriptional regulator [Carnobacterium maltaromaticum]TFJ36536.1 AbrB family transcriptional regulator [Carnobacterium maltaromaticum]TFJ43882.1 AbrB family transcriptional regulator [Carnobacterium maltaromaticum]
MHKKTKVIRIGNSLGVILPKDNGITVDESLTYKENGSIIQLDLSETQKLHDRNLIEESFKDFEEGNVVTEKEMVKEFGNYRWGN